MIDIRIIMVGNGRDLLDYKGHYQVSAPEAVSFLSSRLARDWKVREVFENQVSLGLNQRCNAVITGPEEEMAAVRAIAESCWIRGI